MKIDIRNKIIILMIVSMILILSSIVQPNVYATNDEKLINTTRAYFCSEITKGYSCGDCILLENYDENGNTVYGLIDAGRNLKKDNQEGKTVVEEYLNQHGVKKLEFFLLTHMHADHVGDVETVLNNFEVKNIIMQEFDQKWSPSGRQDKYENMLKIAIDKNINVIGVSYESITSEKYSPSRSEELKKYVEKAKKSLFNGFYYNDDEDNNIIFKFGSSTIKIFNWEIFSEDGTQYITGKTKDKTREIEENDNNNSLVLLLMQGNKKALFSGDMNNLDEDNKNLRVGDEDRIKNQIGDIDFLKLGHHGNVDSNTNDYINVLKPEYAVITNDVGGAYKDILNYMNEKDVKYLYSTSDDYGVTATITSNEVYLGFETNGFKKIESDLLYIAEEDVNKDYTKSSYKIKYIENDMNENIDSWQKLKEKIENVKKELDSENRICKIDKLNINLKASKNWNATSQIEIKPWNRVTLSTDENVKFLRDEKLTNLPLFYVEGQLDIGKENMQGNITLDGNKNNVIATRTLVEVENGTLNLYKGVTLCNNINKTMTRTKVTSTIDYTSFGSGIYCTNGLINMYGGKISNNALDVEYTRILEKNTSSYNRCSSLGGGVYVTNNSIFNMYDGEISENEANNNSTVKTNAEYTNADLNRGIIQGICGVGIYSERNSTVNLNGGKITRNVANNNSITNLRKGTSTTINTNVYSLNTCIYGVAIYSNSGKVNITGNVEISNNTANLNSKVTIEEDVVVKNSVNVAVRGTACYLTDSDVKIDGTGKNSIVISENKYTQNQTIKNKGKAEVSTECSGGGLNIKSNSTFDIKNLNLSKSYSDQGGGIYIGNSKGTISDCEIVENTSTNFGGGVFATLSDLTLKNTNIRMNSSKNGGGMYIANKTSNTEIENCVIEKNSANEGNGGGIYAYGNISISGENTRISDNKAFTAGGLMIRNNAEINDGVISNNIAEKYSGGGARVKGTLKLNGGSFTNNTANTNGGGIDYTDGDLSVKGGKIKNNKALKQGNEIYPEDNKIVDVVKPIIQIKEISKDWTNQNILVEIVVKEEDSGIKEVTVNGNLIKEKNGIYQYIATENGTFEVTAKDNAENEEIAQFSISSIDKSAPIITGVADGATYNEDVVIDAKDELSGIKSLVLSKDGQIIKYNLGEELRDSGKYKVVVEDNCNNVTRVQFEIDRSLKNDDIKIDGLNSNWTNSDQIITLTINNQIQNIEINDEEVKLTDKTYKIIATKNEVYKINITDLDGKVITKLVKVSNIDKGLPEILGVIEGKVYTEKMNVIVRDEGSGILKILLIKDGNEEQIDSPEFEISKNGKYEIRVLDKAGNERILKFTLDIKENNTSKEENKDTKKDDENKKNTDIQDSEKNDKEPEEISDNDSDMINKNNENILNKEIDSGNMQSQQDDTVVNKRLPKTGVGNILIISIIVVAIICVILMKKNVV